MQIIHIMQDGTIRESVEGLVVKNPEIIALLQSIKETK